MKRIKAIEKYYGINMQKALYDHEILGWESKEAQYARFSVLKNSINLKSLKLLDVGCGLGNLLEYLNEQNIEIKYTGVDVLCEMIERAKKKSLNGEFICGDVFSGNMFKSESFDVIYASGIFNLNLGNNKEFLKQAIQLFVELSSKYICFNLLHYKSPNKEDTYYYFSPKEALEIINEANGDNKLEISIVEEYLKNDFTVICKKI